jgi:hypothetical protein
LLEETTKRWLADSCPGRRLESDKADLETRFSQPCADRNEHRQVRHQQV